MVGCDGVYSQKLTLDGDRTDVRQGSVRGALSMLLERLSGGTVLFNFGLMPQFLQFGFLDGPRTGILSRFWQGIGRGQDANLRISVFGVRRVARRFTETIRRSAGRLPGLREARTKKKISAAGFRLTGGGWYETDFKTSDKKKNLAGDTKPSESDKPTQSKPAESGSDKKTEPKKVTPEKKESAA